MAEPLKNQFLQSEYFHALGEKTQEVYPEWSQEKLMQNIYNDQWGLLELKGRMSHASFAVGKNLPEDFKKATDILLKVSRHFSGFDGLLFSEYVQNHGIEHPDISLNALEVFTQYGTAEFAIRPFIERYEEMTMSRMLVWSKNENEHVRRLSSEGCRPRLPWASALPKFKKDPSQILSILENLKDDPSLYVRKSVANNLNDISKDHPETVLALLEKWNEDASKDRLWIIKQALRGLIKAGNPRALSIIGFEKVAAKIEDLSMPEVVKLGDKFKFSFKLTNPSRKSAQYLIDYVVYHQKANGTLTPKVFKIGSFTAESTSSKTIEKTHAIVPITTRKYYAGEHKIAIQVNGEILQSLPFILEID